VNLQTLAHSSVYMSLFESQRYLIFFLPISLFSPLFSFSFLIKKEDKDTSDRAV
jgi:hypothetical protein